MPDDLFSYLMFTLALTPILGFGLLALMLHIESKPKNESSNTDGGTTEKQRD